jgi:regulatory protein YycH of two-component signal transduction system YycFG
MKKILIALNIVVWSLVTYQVAHAEAQIKKVCHVDEKTKKEVCKTTKVHKKLEGTPVPEKAQKK